MQFVGQQISFSSVFNLMMEESQETEGCQSMTRIRNANVIFGMGSTTYYSAQKGLGQATF